MKGGTIPDVPNPEQNCSDKITRKRITSGRLGFRKGIKDRCGRDNEGESRSSQIRGEKCSQVLTTLGHSKKQCSMVSLWLHTAHFSLSI